MQASFYALCIGRLLEPGDKILIDTRKWDYLDLLVVSNEPERFVLNSGPDPYEPERSILDAAIPVDLKSAGSTAVSVSGFRNTAVVRQFC